MPPMLSNGAACCGLVWRFRVSAIAERLPHRFPQRPPGLFPETARWIGKPGIRASRRSIPTAWASSTMRPSRRSQSTSRSALECRQNLAARSSASFHNWAGRNQQETLQTQSQGEISSPPAGAAAAAGSLARTLPPGLADHRDYEIKRELGRGGMGVVYLAHNTLLGRDEVLKVMGRHIMERPERRRSLPP